MKYKLNLLYCVIFSVFMSMAISISSNAAELDLIKDYDKVRLLVENYEVTEGNVLPGRECEIKLTIRNLSSNLPAKGVVVTVANNQGIAFPVEGKSNQISIGDIEADSVCEAVIPIRISENVGEAENVTLILYFSYTDLSFAESTNEAGISIPLESSLGVTQINLADNCYVNQNSILSSEVTNDGSVVAKNVKLHVKVPGLEEMIFEMGNINGGITKQYDSTICIPQAGEQTMTAYLTYEDGDGRQYTSEQVDYVVRVLEGNGHIAELQNNSSRGVNSMFLIENLALVFIALIVMIVFHKRDTRRIASRKEVGYGERS